MMAENSTFHPLTIIPDSYFVLQAKMQYQVPQFIETEDKIIGGILTLRQFLIIAAAGGISFLLYFLFSPFAWAFLTSILGLVAAGIAFVKVQGRSVPVIAKAAFNYYWSPRFYLWQSERKDELTGAETRKETLSVTSDKTFIFQKRHKIVSQPAYTMPISQAKIEAAEKGFTVRAELPPQNIEESIVREPAALRREATIAEEPMIKTAMPSVNIPAADDEFVETPKEKEAEQKKAMEALEAKLLKQEARLEHEVEAIKQDKARLEAELKEAAEERMKAKEAEKLKSEKVREESILESRVAKPEIKPETKNMRPKEEMRRESQREMPAIDSHLLQEKRQEKEALINPRSLAAKSEIKAGGVFQSIEETAESTREKLSRAGKVQDLFQRITTSKTFLPKRERGLLSFMNKSREQFQVLRKATGELERARRVDYSGD